MKLSLTELKQIVNIIENNMLNNREGNELYINVDGPNDVEFKVGNEVILTKKF